MQSFIDYTISHIKKSNPLHSKKINKNLNILRKDNFFDRATEFLANYDQILTNTGRTREYAVDCYLKMIADVTYESILFNETGRYTSTSFKEVNERVYNNPEVMEYYMHGLLVSQFLWRHHFEILKFYVENIKTYKNEIKNYLEVGGGHGLYVKEAIREFGNDKSFEVVDISESSIEMSKNFVGPDLVKFTHGDVHEYSPPYTFDFITMGEVLEHVEDPVKLLRKLFTLLSPMGTVFITTPTNAPAIDHIYLFKDENDIISVINQAGFEVVKDIKIYSEDVPEEIAREMKITMMYAAFIKKPNQSL